MSTEDTDQMLFSGIIQIVYFACPNQFKRLDNDWNRFASFITRRKEFDPESWTFQSEDATVRDWQLSCLRSIVGAPGNAHHHEREAVAAWMLSGMLKRIPK